MNLINRLFSSTLFHSVGTQQGNNVIANKELLETKLADYEHLDPIIRLLLNSFQLCELENQMFSLNMLHIISPQVASTLMWFMKEFVRNYLYMKEVNINL